MTTPRKRSTPRTARTESALCRLYRDHVETATMRIILNETDVDIFLKKGNIAYPVSRKDWDAIVDWYMTGRWRAPRA